jgi:hypothetical protein
MTKTHHLQSWDTDNPLRSANSNILEYFQCLKDYFPWTLP